MELTLARCQVPAAVVDRFVAGLVSSRTRANYRATLVRWLGWLDARGVEVFAVRGEHVESYIRHLEADGYATSTICQRVSALSSFYRWCVAEQHLAHNPVANARLPRRPPESTRQALSRHELTDWLDAAERRGGYPYATACLLAMNGLRVGELCATDVTDLDEHTWHRVLRLRPTTTKGNKPAIIALSPRTMQAIDRALDGRASGPLLLNRAGRRMTPYNVQYLVGALCRDIGVTKRITPHSLRHSAITIALDAGVSLRDVQDFARHEDPRTTRRYDRARNQLNRHATYAITQYLAGGS